MRKNSALLGGVALGVLLAVSAGATADAKAVKHHRAHTAAGPSALEEKVETLSAAVSDLENRLNEEAQARQALQAQAQAAQADAAAARADAQAAHNQLAEQIQTIPGAVKSEVGTAIAANKPKPSWADNTTVSGTMFANASFIDQKPRPSANSNNVLNKNQNGFNYDIKRFYISIDHKFNDVFSANVTTDFTYDNATVTVAGTPAQTLTVAGCTPQAPAVTCTVTVPAIPSQTLVSGDKVGQLYLKKAYLQAKLSDALIFRLGSADLPWVPFVEGIYGNRYVENIMIDRDKFGTSADWGIHVLGALPVSKDLTVNYAVSAINGLGYKQPAMGTFNRSNSMDFEGRVSATYAKKFTVAVGGYEGKLGSAVQGVKTYHNAERFDALAAYVDPRFRVGVEYFYANGWSDVLQSNPALVNSSQGVSAFGGWNFMPKWSVFGRYDWVKPKEHTASSFQDNYFNIGVSYEPVKTVDFALVYKRDAVDNGALSTSNGTIGVSGSHTHGTYDEVGVWTQVKW
jgi:hypothetical protein